MRKAIGVWILSTAAGVLLAFPISAGAQEDLSKMDYGGRLRTYHLHAPQNNPGPYPLVMVFHGALGNAFSMERMSGFSEKAEAEGFLVVYPNGTSNNPAETRELTFNGGNCCGDAWASQVDDVGFIRALVARLKREYPIDPERVYSTGFSNGALLTYRLACRMAGELAAIAPVSGALEPDCAPSAPLSVITLHGTEDQKVLYEGGISPDIPGALYDEPVSFAVEFWARHNQCDKEPVRQTAVRGTHLVYKNCTGGTAVEHYALTHGGHDWPQKATGIIWEFFKSHPRSSEGDAL